MKMKLSELFLESVFGKSINDTPDKVCDPIDDGQLENKKSNEGNGDVIQKIQDVVNKLPELWVSQPTLRGFINELFGLDCVADRYSAVGMKTFLDTVVTSRAADYIFAADSIVSLLAPNTVVSNLSNVVRNVVLLDKMVDQITNKIEFSDELEGTTEIVNALKDAKDCPIKLRDYYVDRRRGVRLLGLFANMMSTYAVGTTVELKSGAFEFCGGPRILHCTLIYKNLTMQDTDIGYVARNTTASNLVIVCDIPEYHVKLFMASYLVQDHKDVLQKLSPSSTLNAHLLYENEADRDTTPSIWCDALPFSMVDFSTNVLMVYKNFIDLNKRQFIANKVSKEIFDKKTDELVRRIRDGNSMYCSRSYALVGIPGTGKSFIMNKIVKDDKDSVVIIPEFVESGFSFEQRNLLTTIIGSIANEHIYIILDDFDKVMSIDGGSDGKSTQELIFFFDYLRTECPGGYDTDGNPRKTVTLIATMNNPKAFANAVIKRSERFDEVIEIGLPQPFVYGKRLNMLKDKGDLTDFEQWKFRVVYWYMRYKVITLADIGNIYAIMKTHRPKKCETCRYTVGDLLYAVKYIGKNRMSASKEYEI